jgi:hypothetical protein
MLKDYFYAQLIWFIPKLKLDYYFSNHITHIIRDKFLWSLQLKKKTDSSI